VTARGRVGGIPFDLASPAPDGAGTVTLGPVEVTVTPSAIAPSTFAGGGSNVRRVEWSVANRGDAPVSLRAVSVRLVLEASPPLRVLRHGYQSWSACGGAVLGVDSDPSVTPGALRFLRMMHHADGDPAGPGELRSELVTVVRDASGDALLVGFEGGDRHDGTLRLLDRDGRSVSITAETFLGGAVLDSGSARDLHAVVVEAGDEHATLLDTWAARVGALAGARTSAPYRVGWCSWYQYFHDVDERAVRENLALAADWPFDVFQVDDGFQRAIGDWLDTNDRFPSPHDRIASDIAATGAVPGIWLAPFLAHPDSAVARAHPDWFARWTDGERPLVGGVNEQWGGMVWTLDTTRPEVLDHLERTSRALVECGYRYLKLDFTYAPAFDGCFADPYATPAERVRAGFDAVRRGAGDETFLLGCGAPIGPTVGAVDGMRIGPDVAPWWSPRPRGQPGYGDTGPATLNAWRNTLARSFLHRRFWLNDPDCLMLRAERTELGPASTLAWALAVGASGGMAIVSDDLSLLGSGARRLLDEVIAAGRWVDDRATSGRPPHCPDLLDTDTPTRLRSADLELVGDVTAGTATLAREW
jgi:alpha-galactosidase